MGRVTAVVARAVLLADQEVVHSVLAVSERVTETINAYGVDALYRRKKARAGRAEADLELQEALAHLVVVVQAYLHPAPTAQSWWRRMIPGARRRALGATASAPPIADIATRPALPATSASTS